MTTTTSTSKAPVTLAQFVETHGDDQGRYMPIWTLEQESARQTLERFGPGALVVAHDVVMPETGQTITTLEDPNGNSLTNYYPRGTSIFGGGRSLWFTERERRACWQALYSQRALLRQGDQTAQTKAEASMLTRLMSILEGAR